MQSPPTVALVANIIFTLAKSRRGLIESLLAGGHRVLVVAPDGEDRHWLEGLAVDYLPLRRMARSGLNPLADLRLLTELRTIFRRQKVDLAFLFNIKPVIYGSLAARGTKTRVVSTITGAGNVFLKPGWLRRSAELLYSVALRNNGVVFFQNDDDRDQFLQAGLVKPEQVRRVGGAGVDLSVFKQQPPGTVGKFLFVGRLLNDKGIREFVEAANQVYAVAPMARFTVLGSADPANREAIDAKTLQTWRGRGVVRFVPHAEDVRPLIAEHGVVVLPSYREGLPRVLIEAAAMARPLITTDVPGCRAVVLPGETGWLVPARNTEALAAAMLSALQLPAGRLAEMCRAARRDAENRFDQRIVNAAYLGALRDILSLP